MTTDKNAAFEAWFEKEGTIVELDNDAFLNIHDAFMAAWEARELQAYGTRNLSMIAKLEAGQAIDLRHHQRLGPYWLLECLPVEGMDYCVTGEEAGLWIWSIGQANDHQVFDFQGDEVVVPKGTILAAGGSELYQNALFTCHFLR
jgi:hypothetical protein